MEQSGRATGKTPLADPHTLVPETSRAKRGNCPRTGPLDAALHPPNPPRMSENTADQSSQERRVGPTVSRDKWYLHAKQKLARGYKLIVARDGKKRANFWTPEKGFEMCAYEVARALVLSGEVHAVGEHPLGTMYELVEAPAPPPKAKASKAKAPKPAPAPVEDEVELEALPADDTEDTSDDEDLDADAAEESEDEEDLGDLDDDEDVKL